MAVPTIATITKVPAIINVFIFLMLLPYTWLYQVAIYQILFSWAKVVKTFDTHKIFMRKLAIFA